MTNKTINRYIWLVNLLQDKKALTLEEISKHWQESGLGDGRPLSERTFHAHVKAIKKSLGVVIKCNPYNKYRYAIADNGALKKDRTRQWLLNSFSLSNMIIAGHNLMERVVFEYIPHGTEYLTTIIEAMQENKKLKLDYQPFDKHNESYIFHPYAMKVYRQRWYMLGEIEGKEDLRNLALDRVLALEKTDEAFKMPQNFSAIKFYSDTVGIYVNPALKPKKVIIRIFDSQVDYVRSVPIHSSQEEICTKHGEFSDFQYRVCLTPELATAILSMGEKALVLEPQELKDEIKKRLTECLSKYK